MSSLVETVHTLAKTGKPDEIATLLKNKPIKEVNKALNTATKHGNELTTPLLIAAKNQHEDVVNLLLNIYCVYPDQTGTLEVENQILNFVTALWITGETGNIPIAEMLIKFGASVNHPSGTLSTPLRSATYASNLEMVKLLLKHGADPNWRNDKGNTPLNNLSGMKTNSAVTVALLEAGANPNIKSHSNSTAVHGCVDHGTLDDARALLRHGGLLTIVNDDGLTPLHEACVEKKDEIVECFVLHRSISLEEKVQAYELLGATLIAENEGINEKGYNYMLQSLKILESMKKKKPNQEPRALYDNRKECDTVSELQQIKDDSYLLHIEALMITERILGRKSWQYTYCLRYFGALLADEEKFSKALVFALTALDCEFVNKKRIARSLDLVVTLFACCLVDKKAVKLKIVIDMLDKCSTELLRLKKEKASDMDGKIDMNEMLMLSAQLVAMCQKLAHYDEEKSSENHIKFSALVKKLSLINAKSNSGKTVLHYACLQDTFTPCEQMAQALEFPPTSVVRVLLQAGFDPNVQDNDGNTPMHIIVQYVQGSTDITTLNTIVTMFTEAKVNKQLRNKQGLTPLEVAKANISVETNRQILTMVQRLVNKKK